MALPEKLIILLADKVLNILIDKFDNSIFLSKNQAIKHLEIQFRKVSQWSSKLELFELSKGVELSDFTLNLSLTDSPNKLAKLKTKYSFNSDSLANLESNILVLGEPGSGKTTTLKRVLQKMLDELSIEEKKYKTPLLFRLRDTDLSKPLIILIAEYLGIDYNIEEKSGKYFVCQKPLEYAIINILDSINSHIFFDGLDEINPSNRVTLLNEISELCFKLEKTKILVTSRSGDYNSLLEGFSVYELESLNPKQIEEISSMWFEEPIAFLNELKDKPYKDTVDRPLVLINLIILYLNTGYLPDQPSSIYEKLIDLFIEKWDAKRRIVRKSKYANFLPSQKLKFLSELAFQLLYKMGTPHISFSKRDLLTVYKTIHSQYRLPENEAEEIVKEIQSHNGLIIENFDNQYQFSHLTYQEYLSALYIVRNPVIDETLDFIKKRPAPVAVAISLASNPNKWIESLFLGQEIEIKLENSLSQLIEFIERINMEKPYFSESGITGFAMLNIAYIFKNNDKVISALELLFEDGILKKSINRALNSYDKSVNVEEPEYYDFLLKRQPSITSTLSAPISGMLLKSFANKILN